LCGPSAAILDQFAKAVPAQDSRLMRVRSCEKAQRSFLKVSHHCPLNRVEVFLAHERRSDLRGFSLLALKIGLEMKEGNLFRFRLRNSKPANRPKETLKFAWLAIGKINLENAGIVVTKIPAFAIRQLHHEKAPEMLAQHIQSRLGENKYAPGRFPNGLSDPVKRQTPRSFPISFIFSGTDGLS